MFVLPTVLAPLVGPWIIDALDPIFKTIVRTLKDPNGTLSRVGEALVWSGPSGQKVIGGLEMLSDSQARINVAVNGIETTQLAMQGTLGVVSTVSIATLGITSLTGALMLYRLQALNKRVENLKQDIADVAGKIDAQNKAHLKASLQFLREYENSPQDKDSLTRALDESRDASNIYGFLAADEADGKKRLEVLNCRGRFYVISLLTELRCMMCSNDSKAALQRIDDEVPTLKKIAKVCFNNTLKANPERYLRSAFQAHDVNLNLLTHIYQQAKQLKLIEKPQIDDANAMFEFLRPRGVNTGRSGGSKGWKRWLRPTRHVDEDMKKLRYLAACLEETSRIAGLKMIISAVQEKDGSLSELVEELRKLRDKQVTQEKKGDAPPVFAYPI